MQGQITCGDSASRHRLADFAVSYTDSQTTVSQYIYTPQQQSGIDQTHFVSPCKSQAYLTPLYSGYQPVTYCKMRSYPSLAVRQHCRRNQISDNSGDREQQ